MGWRLIEFNTNHNIKTHVDNESSRKKDLHYKGKHDVLLLTAQHKETNTRTRQTQKNTCHPNKFLTYLDVRHRIHSFLSVSAYNVMLTSLCHCHNNNFTFYQSFHWQSLSSSGKPRLESITTPLGHFAYSPVSRHLKWDAVQFLRNCVSWLIISFYLR